MVPPADGGSTPAARPCPSARAVVTRLSHGEAAARVRGAANLQRLAAVKARVDPDGIFAATPHAPVLAAAAAEQ